MHRIDTLYKFILLLLISLEGYSQQNEDSLNRYAGTYYVRIDSSKVFIIRNENHQLFLSIPGQGQTPMHFISKNLYKPAQVKPEAFIEFVQDSLGGFNKLFWRQDLKMEIFPSRNFHPDKPSGSPEELAEYAGEYFSKKPSRNTWNFKIIAGQLTAKINDEPRLELKKVTKDQFVYQTPDFTLLYEFKRNGKGELVSGQFTKTGGVDLIRRSQNGEDAILANHISNRQNGFTRADSLQGMLSVLRNCYDVAFYHLDLRVFPETKSISGNNLIRFRVVNAFSKMQIDLYKNMKIEHVLFKNIDLPYTREFNAVFINFPEELKAGATEEIRIYYSGSPQQPDLSIPMNGGFLWMKDQNGEPWIESVCQGSGASLWWPCKDHLSDKPDSMAISITVPKGLLDISNGQLRNQTQLPDNLTRFDWFVSYPIINYDVVVNIGDYAHFTEPYQGIDGSYALHYYYMPADEEKARDLFSRLKPILGIYEKQFGPYPFPKDGFTVMESLYPMEHQSAVSIGQIDSKHYDGKEMERLMGHETAHEWWGNSVSCKDMADLWIHEAFATYSEYLKSESFFGKSASLADINRQTSSNKEPLIGIYNVNHIHYDIGDMYSKGSLMLNTLRHVINNDSLFFAMLKGLQKKFKYQSVSTEDIIGFVNEITGTDYTYFFDQYLNHTEIPILELRTSKKDEHLILDYRWDSTVAAFKMPVRINLSNHEHRFIQPVKDWQSIDLGSRNSHDIKVEKNEYYIMVRTDTN